MAGCLFFRKMWRSASNFANFKRWSASDFSKKKTNIHPWHDVMTILKETEAYILIVAVLFFCWMCFSQKIINIWCRSWEKKKAKLMMKFWNFDCLFFQFKQCGRRHKWNKSNEIELIYHSSLAWVVVFALIQSCLHVGGVIPNQMTQQKPSNNNHPRTQSQRLWTWLWWFEINFGQKTLFCWKFIFRD